MMEVHSRFKRGPVPQPSLSKLKDVPPVNYPDEPINAMALIQAESEYLRPGVEYFTSKEIYQLTKEDRAAAIEFMNAVIAAPNSDFEKELWDKIRDQGQQLVTRLPKQSGQEPMVNLCLAIAENRSEKFTQSAKRFDDVVSAFSRDHYPTRLPIVAIRFINTTRSDHQSAISYGTRIAALQYWVKQ